MSSFDRPVTKEERAALGDPADALDGDEETLKTWLGWMRHGGGRALEGVARIVAQKPDGASSAVAKLLGQGGVPFDARGYAARCLGELGAKEQADALAKAVLTAPSKNQSFVAIEAARALARVGTGQQRRSLDRALDSWTKFFESKVPGSSPVAFSDWERSLHTLAALVESWGALSVGAGEGKAVCKTVVSRVLAPNHDVRTSKRVPQDPSLARTALASAIAQAFAKAKASEREWALLADAVASDPRAKASVESARK